MADLSRGDLYYEAAGDGPAVLLLHTGITDSRMWDGQFETLARSYRAIRCDLRGYGRSAVLPGQFSYEEDLLQLLDYLSVEQAFLVGMSFGGRIALDFTLQHPERVLGLILGAPSISGQEPGEEVILFAQEEEALLENNRVEEATELNLRMWVDGPYRRPEQVDPELRRRVWEMQLHAFQLPLPDDIEVRQIDPPAFHRLDQVRVPVLVISGALDVPSFQKGADYLAQSIPSARQIVFPDAAHLVSMERPERFMRILLSFLDEHSGAHTAASLDDE